MDISDPSILLSRSGLLTRALTHRLCPVGGCLALHLMHPRFSCLAAAYRRELMASKLLHDFQVAGFRSVRERAKLDSSLRRRPRLSTVRCFLSLARQMVLILDRPHRTPRMRLTAMVKSGVAERVERLRRDFFFRVVTWSVT